MTITVPLQPQEEARLVAMGQAQLESLQGFYRTIGPKDAIVNILAEEPALCALLKEAVTPIHREFGSAVLLQLKAQQSDEDSLIRVTIQSHYTIEDAERALERFDENWWLDNCDRSTGSLIFDYAVSDAV